MGKASEYLLGYRFAPFRHYGEFIGTRRNGLLLNDFCIKCIAVVVCMLFSFFFLFSLFFSCLFAVISRICKKDKSHLCLSYTCNPKSLFRFTCVKISLDQKTFSSLSRNGGGTLAWETTREEDNMAASEWEDASCLQPCPRSFCHAWAFVCRFCLF